MKNTSIAFILSALLLAAASLPAVAQEDASPARLLLVDQTKTFASTMRVAALAKTLREFDAAPLELTVRLTETTSPYGNPLEDAPLPPEAPFHMIIIIPRGIDDGTADRIWLITTLASSPPSPEWEGVELLGLLIDTIFEGVAAAVDPMEDLWPAMLAAGYAAQGWLE